MRPAWFSLSDDSLDGSSVDSPSPAVPGPSLPPIPYDQMWADDVHWLFRLVRGERFVGRADMDNGNVMVRYWFGHVESESVRRWSVFACALANSLPRSSRHTSGPCRDILRSLVRVDRCILPNATSNYTRSRHKVTPLQHPTSKLD